MKTTGPHSRMIGSGEKPMVPNWVGHFEGEGLLGKLLVELGFRGSGISTERARRGVTSHDAAPHVDEI